MTNNKQQTAVDSIIELCKKRMFMEASVHQVIYLSLIKFCEEQAKEMEKEQTINFTEDWYFNGPLLGVGIDVKSTIEQHFNNTHEGGEQ